MNASSADDLVRLIAEVQQHILRVDGHVARSEAVARECEASRREQAAWSVQSWANMALAARALHATLVVLEQLSRENSARGPLRRP